MSKKREEAEERAEWIYEDIPEQQELFEKIEAALGFKLFIWQKMYIMLGYYRKSGQTTAWALRELLSDKIIDFTSLPKSCKEKHERRELQRLKQRLEDAGIKTAQIATNREQLKRLEEARGGSEVTRTEVKALQKVMENLETALRNIVQATIKVDEAMIDIKIHNHSCSLELVENLKRQPAESEEN